MKNITIFIFLGIIAVIIIIGAVYYTSTDTYLTPTPSLTNTANDTNSWSTVTDPRTGASFRYPQTLGTQYISTTDWPPQIQVIDDVYSCIPGGSETARAGITEERNISGRTYCITRVSEGAAGSVYTQYAYAFPRNDRTVVLTFSLRFHQCGNYEDSVEQLCEGERSRFDINSILNRVAQTVNLN